MELRQRIRKHAKENMVIRKMLILCQDPINFQFSKPLSNLSNNLYKGPIKYISLKESICTIPYYRIRLTVR